MNRPKVATVLLCLVGAVGFHRVLVAQGKSSGVRVINSGVPGENSTELRSRFSAELSRWSPRCVVIYTGMNDAANDKKFNSPEAYSANLLSLLMEARSKKVDVVLVAIQPVDEERVLKRHPPGAYGSELPNQRIRKLNEILDGLSRRFQVPLVRFDTVLQDAGGPAGALSVDGIHLSPEGYGLLARAVFASLPHGFRAGATILCLGDSLTYGIGVRPANAGEMEPDGRAYPTYPQQLQQMIDAARRPHRD